MTQRTKERLGGLLIAGCGLGLIAFNWHVARTEQAYYLHAAVAGPAFAVMGFALLLWPGYRTERRARGEDLTQLAGCKLITRRWWLILCAGLGAGFLNWYLLAHADL